jgi:glucose/mannose transport system substrate-binding protein
MFTQVLAHSDIDRAASDWQPAIDPIIEGDAAYNVMGDWANTYFATAKGLEFETEYDVTTSPGTESIFNFLSDSFTLPTGASHRDAAVGWLRLAGSKEGQDAFNPIKGSIPARTDADTSLYTDYLAMPLADWTDESTQLVGSLAHGVVAGGAFNTEIDSALGEFVSEGDAAAFATAVKEAYEANQ